MTTRSMSAPAPAPGTAPCILTAPMPFSSTRGSMCGSSPCSGAAMGTTGIRSCSSTKATPRWAICAATSSPTSVMTGRTASIWTSRAFPRATSPISGPCTPPAGASGPLWPTRPAWTGRRPWKTSPLWAGRCCIGPMTPPSAPQLPALTIAPPGSGGSLSRAGMPPVGRRWPITWTPVPT